MKRILTLALFVLGILIISQSCQKAPFVTMNTPRSFTFTRDGGTQNITFTCNRDWSVSSSESWIQVSPSSGTASDGDVTVKITCTANTTYDPRSATITVKVEELSETISISQDTGLGLLVSPKTFDLTNAAQTIEIEVQKNVQYSISIDEAAKDWITHTGTKGLTSEKVTFSIAANETFDNRETSITIKQNDGSLAETVKIKQAQTNIIIIDTKEYEISHKTTSLTVDFQSNTDISAISKVDWISIIETKAINNKSVILSIENNDTFEPRTGEICIQDKKGSISESVFVTQSGLVKKEVSVEEAGTLNEKLGVSSNEIAYLIVHGFLNGSDIRVIRQMPELIILDIFDTKIVSGGDTYYDSYRTFDNVIGTYMFFEKAYKQVFLPKTIVRIEERAFYQYKGDGVVIPNGVIEIGHRAFSECPILSAIKIPDSVTTIGDYVFNNSSALTKIEFGNGLSDTGLGTCMGCTSLKDIILPESIVSIGNGSFYGCYGLEAIQLPSKLQSIGVDGFRCCSGLKELILPDSVKSLEENAFNCYNVTSSLSTVKLGNNLEYIGDGCFYRAGKLREIIIPAKVTYMGHDCFGYCESLSNIKVKPLTPPQVTEYGSGYGRIHFYGLPSDAVMYVPSESLTKYQEAEHWRKLAYMMVGF